MFSQEGVRRRVGSARPLLRLKSIREDGVGGAEVTGENVNPEALEK